MSPAGRTRDRRRTRRRWAVALVGAVAVLALAVLAAGGPGDGPAGTSLIVVVRPSPSADPVRMEPVDCSEPRRPRACDRLEDLEPRDLAPTPRSAVCTEIYGGPAVATVRGRLGGERVDARFTRHNGCEIARWDRLSWLLGRPPAEPRAKRPRGG